MTAAGDGLVPAALAPRTLKIVIRDLELMLDIGFHPAEIGNPQRLLVTIEVWLDEEAFAAGDDPAAAWDYDALKRAVTELAGAKRVNLQETLAREIYDLVAARRGVTALRVATGKPDIYPDCALAGVELASF